MDIESYNFSNWQYVISDAEKMRFSSHYGENGGGFGYLKFDLKRRTGSRYNDIGFGYRLIVRKGLQVVFDGVTREILEKNNAISVTAIGYSKASEDAEEIARNFCSTDISKWVTPSQFPAGNYRPDLYSTSQMNGSLVMHCNANPIQQSMYSELIFQFFPGEVAERIKCDMLVNLGRGVTFNGEVDSIDAGSNYVFYKNNSDETKIAVDMTLVNLTQNLGAVITGVDTGLNRITLGSSPSSWQVDDEIYISGPFFSATISNISGSIITYSNDIGEGNLSTSYTLIDMTKKDAVAISSFNTTANTITVGGDISSWSINDQIMITAPLFSATISSIVSDRITYTNQVGDVLVSSDTGWVVHNIDTGTVTTLVQWWPPDEFDAFSSGEVSGWSPTDTIYIYSPFNAEIIDDNDQVLWPTDWRDGAINGLTTGIDALSTGSPTAFRMRFKNYISGTSDESSFARMSNIKAYSVEVAVTAENISKEILPILSGLGISSSEGNISSITKVIEPAVFEYKDIKEVLTNIASFGSQSSARVAWGIKPDDTRTFYLEEYPTDVGYRISKAEGSSSVEASADLGESVQRVRGIYTDELGNKVVMDWIEDTDAFFGSYKISRTETLSNINNGTDAQSYITLLLSEEASPPLASRYDISGDSITDKYGNKIPFDEIVANGKFIEVEDFRSSMSGDNTGDLSANWVRDFVSAVEIDIASKKVTMIPGKARKTFLFYMSELSRVAKI